MSGDLEPDKRVKVFAREPALAVNGQAGGYLEEVDADAVACVVCRHQGGWYVESPYPGIYFTAEELARRPDVSSFGPGTGPPDRGHPCQRARQ